MTAFIPLSVSRAQWLEAVRRFNIVFASHVGQRELISQGSVGCWLRDGSASVKVFATGHLLSVSSSAIWGWRALVRGVPMVQWVAALLPVRASQTDDELPELELDTPVSEGSTEQRNGTLEQLRIISANALSIWAARGGWMFIAGARLPRHFFEGASA
jgi:hypothetical protein